MDKTLSIKFWIKSQSPLRSILGILECVKVRWYYWKLFNKLHKFNNRNVIACTDHENLTDKPKKGYLGLFTFFCQQSQGISEKHLNAKV